MMMSYPPLLSGKMTCLRLQPVISDAHLCLLRSLAVEIWNEHFPPIIGQAQVDYMLESVQSREAILGQMAEGYDYFLIWLDTSAEGYISLLHDEESHSTLISKFYLRASQRGRGRGQLALQQIIEISRNQGCARLWLTVNRLNTRAILAYTSMGFRTFDAQKKDIGGGFEMDDFLMEKFLEVPA